MHPTLPLQPPSTSTSTSTPIAPSFQSQSSYRIAQPPGPGGDASWYDSMLTKLGKQPEWQAEKEQSLLEPYTYLSSVPGKEVRSQLIEAFNFWLKVPKDQLEIIKRVTRMLHTASLLMDDVEDNSTLRRGIPVAHKIYGIPQTINCANYVYFQVFQEIHQLESSLIRGGGGEVHGQDQGEASESNSPLSAETTSKKRRNPPSSSTSNFNSNPTLTSISNLVTLELLNLHRGQGMDLFWRDSLICPTEEDYVEMVNNKTGGLFRIALGLMCRCSSLFKTESVPVQGVKNDQDELKTMDEDEDEDEDEEEEKGKEKENEGQELDLIPLANLIGLLFQIRDDFMNLQSENYAQNKGFAEDLTEGKFSFPIIHGIRSSQSDSNSASTSGFAETAKKGRDQKQDGGGNLVVDGQDGNDFHQSNQVSEFSSIFHQSTTTTMTNPLLKNSDRFPNSHLFNRQLLNILSQKPTDESIKLYAVNYLKNVTGSLDYTREVLRRLDRLAREEVVRIGKSVERKWKSRNEQFGQEIVNDEKVAVADNKHLIAILDALRKGWWDESWE